MKRLALCAALAACGAPAHAVAQPEPAACDVDPLAAPDAPVLRIDCDFIGERMAYTLKAHDDAHRQVAALDAMIDEAKAQRERLRQELTADRMVCAGQVEALGLELHHCSDAVARLGSPPSRLTWAAIGAGIGAAIVAAVFVAAD